MRVVIADDHWSVREGVKFMLSEHDSIDVVGEAEDGMSLIALLDEVEADVVLLDINMPGMGGLDALAQIKTSKPDLGVVILSMHDKAVYVNRAIELGADGYLLKSASRDEVIRALEVVTSGRAYIQGELTSTIIERATTGDSAVPHLSRRELQVLARVAKGEENKQIARGLCISEATVKTYLKSVFEKLSVRTRAEAVAVALRLEIIE